MAVEVKISGASFRSKVRQALDLWVRLHPKEARQFVRQAKLRREAGNADPDMECSAMLPSWPMEVLKQSEFYTQMLYGVPCGTGDRCWDTRNDLMDIFMSEMPEAQISGKTGAPARRGWS